MKFIPENEQVRLVYTDANDIGTVVRGPGKVCAIIGPFDGHMDKPMLQDMLQTLLRGYNVMSGE